jgi:hypothetical protein
MAAEDVDIRANLASTVPPPLRFIHLHKQGDEVTACVRNRSDCAARVSRLDHWIHDTHVQSDPPVPYTRVRRRRAGPTRAWHACADPVTAAISCASRRGRDAPRRAGCGRRWSDLQVAVSVAFFPTPPLTALPLSLSRPPRDHRDRPIFKLHTHSMRTTALILGACAVGASARMEAFKPSKVALSSSPRTQKAVLDIRGELAETGPRVNCLCRRGLSGAVARGRLEPARARSAVQVPSGGRSGACSPTLPWYRRR